MAIDCPSRIQEWWGSRPSSAVADRKTQRNLPTFGSDQGGSTVLNVEISSTQVREAAVQVTSKTLHIEELDPESFLDRVLTERALLGGTEADRTEEGDQAVALFVPRQVLCKLLVDVFTRGD